MQVIGRQVRDPSFHVMQNNFSISAILGEVYAKVGQATEALFGFLVLLITLEKQKYTSKVETQHFNVTANRRLVINRVKISLLSCGICFFSYFPATQ